MFKRQRTSIQDFAQPCNFLYQDITIFGPQFTARINDDYRKLLQFQPHIQAQPPSLESFVKLGYNNCGHNFNNSFVLNDVQIESLCNLPPIQVDISTQKKAPKHKYNTRTKRKPEPIIVDYDSELEREFDSKSKSKARTKPKPKPKPKPEPEPKPRAKAKAKPKPELASTKKGPENESKNPKCSKAKRKKNLQPTETALHEDIKACLCESISPHERSAYDDFISMLDRYATDPKEPRQKIPVLKTVPNPMKQCVYCVQNYSFDVLFNHMLTTHWGSKLKNGLMCLHCESIFDDSRQFAYHCIESHGMIYNDCLFCPAMFVSIKHLINHYEKHKEISCIWRCRFCKSHLNNLDSLKQHLQDKHFIVEENY